MVDPTPPGTADTLFVIGPREGRAPRVETLLGMLDNARRYLLAASRELTSAELSAAPHPAPNPIGALLSHLAAGETIFQRMLFDGARFGEGVDPELMAAFRFESDPLLGADVDAYHARLAAVRETTRTRLAEVDDAWLDTPRTFFGLPSNHHYYWLHYLQDEARHTGQIILIRKHLLPGADPEFEPYALV